MSEKCGCDFQKCSVGDLCVLIAIQGGHSGSSQPPVDMKMNVAFQYRVGHLLADLGWVDLYLECSIILPGQ